MDRAHLPPEARKRRIAFQAWAMAHGRPAGRMAATAILGAKSMRPEPLDDWSAECVRELMWLEIVDWCDGRFLDVPDGVAESLWSLLDHLGDVGALRGADLPALRAPLVDSGGLDGVGGRRHPSTRPAV